MLLELNGITQMSVNLYVVKLKPINIFNLPLALLNAALAERVYDSCSCSIDSNGDIIIDIGKFAHAHSSDPTSKFRTIDWSEQIANLENSIANAVLQGKVLVFGTYRQDQIDYLKDHFGDAIVTVGVEYNENMYPLVLTEFAKKHIRLFELGQVAVTEYDSNIMDSAFDDRLSHYYHAFDQQQLVPRTALDKCDLVIPLNDFYSIDAMQQHIKKLGILFNTATIDLYNQWLTKGNKT
jgi:hypothetical protein